MKCKPIATFALLTTLFFTGACIHSDTTTRAPSADQPRALSTPAVHLQAPAPFAERHGRQANLTPPPIERDWDPVIVTGAHLPHLAGTSTDSLFVYAYRGGGIEQIPFQVDQATASGAYTSTLGSPLDENDEIVFMASDLGEPLPDEQVVYTMPITPPAYTIAVTDPLNAEARGWAYIVRSSTLTQTFTHTYTAFDPVTNRITTTHYALRFASSFPGLDYLALNGYDQDILDRTKIRIGLVLGTINEEQVGTYLGIDPITVIKEGPVRVLATLGVVGYRSALEQSIAFDVPPLISLQSARFSTDFDQDAAGSTFYNANTPPEGVTIDGDPDTSPLGPASPWWQVSGGTGTVVQANDSSGVGGTQTSYYKDDDTEVPGDTGDQRSYGDTGISVESPGETIAYRTLLYMLPPDQENVGETYTDYFQNPLEITATILFPHHNYLPIVLRN